MAKAVATTPQGSTTPTTVTTVSFAGLWEQVVGGARKLYYAFNGQIVAVRDSSAGLAYLHGDHLGSISVASNGSGALASQQEFDPWGKVRAGSMGQTTLNYTGQRLDGSGLLYYHARMYNPVLGRFVSADTIAPGLGNPQNRNRYSYTLNNPLRYTDPTGHCSEGTPRDEAKADARSAENAACETASSELATYGIRILNLQDWLSAELDLILTAVQDFLRALSWDIDRFKTEMGLEPWGGIDIQRDHRSSGNLAVMNDDWGQGPLITFYSGTFSNPDGAKWVVVHELAHVWDSAHGGSLSSGMKERTGSSGFIKRNNDGTCAWGALCYTANGTAASGYGGADAKEDWAESVAATVYPTNHRYVVEGTNINRWDAAKDYTRRDYVREQYQ